MVICLCQFMKMVKLISCSACIVSWTIFFAWRNSLSWRSRKLIHLNQLINENAIDFQFASIESKTFVECCMKSYVFRSTRDYIFFPAFLLRDNFDISRRNLFRVHRIDWTKETENERKKNVKGSLDAGHDVETVNSKKKGENHESNRKSIMNRSCDCVHSYFHMISKFDA